MFVFFYFLFILLHPPSQSLSTIPSIYSPLSSRPRIPILQYTSSHVVINKMPGISVHHSGQSYGRRLVVNTMLKRQLARPVFPVHRLDHRTSGALLFAFTSGDAARLQKALSEGEKTYVAFVRGEWKLAPKLRLDLPVKVSGVEKVRGSEERKTAGAKRQQTQHAAHKHNSQPFTRHFPPLHPPS